MGEAIAAIIAAIIAATAGGIGAGVQSNKLSEAEIEQKRMFDAQTQVGKENNAFQMHQTELQNQLANKQFDMGVQNRNYSVNKDQLQGVADLLNKNTTLKDALLSRWGI